jgi:hypothetical protein
LQHNHTIASSQALTRSACSKPGGMAATDSEHVRLEEVHCCQLPGWQCDNHASLANSLSTPPSQARHWQQAGLPSNRYCGCGTYMWHQQPHSQLWCATLCSCAGLV